MEQFYKDIIKKYGIIGIILVYFLYQDNHSRQLDRQDRMNNIKLMEMLTSKVNDINTRVIILEKKSELKL
ncbi:MAG: hypothetical protein ACRCYT_05385 [Cetobacterium sp.]